MRVDRVIFLRSASVAALLCAGMPAVLHAQTSDTTEGQEQQNQGDAQAAQPRGAVEEIIVTAQRREENIQDVPVAVSAFSGAELERQGSVRFDDIATRVPNLFVASANSVGNTRLNVRGVSSEPNNVGLGNSIPNYVDGIAQGPGRTVNTALFDLEAIEVLRGPQGTLFGRNSTGGAILIRTRQPRTDALDGYVTLEYGNYDNVRGEGAVNVPASDAVAVRLAAFVQQRDGFTRNTTLQRDQNDLESTALRGQALFEFSDTLRLTLRGDRAYDKTNGNVKDFGSNAAGGRLAPGARDFVVNSDAANLTTRRMHSTGAELEYEIGDYRLVSLTSFGWFRYLNIDDVDFTSANVLVTESRVRQRQFSQEVRVESPGDQAFSWVGGLYYFYETTRAENLARGIFATFGGAPNANTNILIGEGDRQTKSYSAFGQAQYRFTDSLSFIAGIRYTHEKSDARKFQPPGRAALGIPPANVEVGTSDGAWSGTAKLVFQPTDDLMAYVSYARGFKGAGFNLAPGGLTDITADPEYVDSYEAGLRTEFWDRRIRFNATGFYYKYEDLQRSTFQVPAGGGLPTLVFGNAGGLDAKGVEVELIARPIPLIGFGGTLGYTDAEFTDYIDPSGVNYEGLRPSRTPKTTASAFADLTFRGFQGVNVSLRGDYLYRSKSFATDTNVVARQIDPVEIVNARFSIADKDGGWELAFFGRNIFNKKYAEDVQPASGFTPGVGLSMGAPRTYGVQLRGSF